MRIAGYSGREAAVIICNKNSQQGSTLTAPGETVWWPGMVLVVHCIEEEFSYSRGG